MPVTEPSSLDTLEAQASAPVPVLPLFYKAVFAIENFQGLFPNVLNLPNLTLQQAFEKLGNQAVKRPFTAPAAGVKTPGTGTVPGLKGILYLHALIKKDENNHDQIYIRIGLYHYETDTNLGNSNMVMYLVDSSFNKRLPAPPLGTFKHIFRPDPRMAAGVVLEHQLKYLWENKAAYFPDGKLRIHIEIGRDFSQEYSALPKTLTNLSCDLLEVLESGDRSDFTIKCGSREFKVHELILVTRSPVFKAMLSHDMLEKDKREVTISDMEPDILEILLKFIYGSKIQLEDHCHAHLFELIVAADKYQVEELKRICFNYVAKEINVSNIGKLAVLAHRHVPSEEIRKRISVFVAENVKYLWKKPEFREVMKECVDFFWDN